MALRTRYTRRSLGPKRLSDSRGFTIVEVAMATFVMTFGIASAIIAMQAGFKTLDVARGTTLASQLLQSEMENIRLLNWGDIEAYGSATATVPLTDLLPDNPDAQAAAARAGFVVRRTVSDVADRVGEMKQILLQASWNTMDQRTLTRSFRTFYTKDGLYDYYYTLARP